MSVGIRVGTFNPNNGTDYIVRSVRHDQAPTLDLETLELSRSEGEKLLSTAYRPKQITLEGLIKGTSISDLEENIDEFKKQMTVRSASLDLDYGGSVRRYGVTTNEIVVTRDFYHTNFAPFEVVFAVLDPPFGFQASSLAGESAVKDALSAENQTVQLYEATVSFEGTAPPRPSFSIAINQAGGLGEISLRALPGGQRLVVATAFTSNDTLEIDTTKLSVLRNQATVRYSGIFPEFELGDNTVLVGFQPRAATTVVLEQEQSDSVVQMYYAGTYGWSRAAQSFVAPATDDYTSIDLLMYKQLLYYESPLDTDDLVVRIETDSGGSPSGTLADADGQVTIPIGSFNDNTPGWVPVVFDNPVSLTSGTTYWIVCKREELDPPSEYSLAWLCSSLNPITTGVMKQTYSGGSYGGYWYTVGGGNFDACFRLEGEIASSNLDWVVDIHAQYRKRYL